MSIKADAASAQERGFRIKTLRKSLKMSRKMFGEHYNISPGTLQNWEDGRFGGLTEKGARRLIEIFSNEGVACSLEWLMYGTERESLTQYSFIKRTEKTLSMDPVIYELECFYQHNQNVIDMIVTDQSMEPYFFKGDHVAGERYFGEDIKKVVGHDCIVQTESGLLILRHLQKEQAGSYDLISHHPDWQNNDSNLSGIKLFSVAPVLWIRRRKPV